MKISRRKLTLQLTPLLDLMLIVFFLQYLQMRENEVKRASAAEIVQQDAVRLAEELEAARRVAADATRTATALQNELAQANARATGLAGEAAAERARVDQVLSREEELGRLIVELFNVPRADIDKVLNDPGAGGISRSPQEVAALRKQFEDMAAARSGRMIKHLLVFDEIRKRCDVWEVFVDSQHLVTVNTGVRTASLRLNLKDDGDPDMERFENEFVEVARGLPDPKSLVVVLLSYDRATRLIVTEALDRSMPNIMRRLAMETAGVRFEYADLGIRIGQ
ncbi:hypothetical protein Pan44_24190 [Caulifigura coniformis]|uniref:Uncharacterized protein n=1 Tax=Caulifigura coniformis TaxID=2527983 RepID=A0A517SE32_9PLAN|nr:hypothetical protein [Caulifigura coniformis]QDT54386.1 hypothetical protein Pan44_24190 [Caulifigura coniformis]